MSYQTSPLYITPTDIVNICFPFLNREKEAVRSAQYREPCNDHMMQQFLLRICLFVSLCYRPIKRMLEWCKTYSNILKANLMFAVLDTGIEGCVKH